MAPSTIYQKSLKNQAAVEYNSTDKLVSELIVTDEDAASNVSSPPSQEASIQNTPNTTTIPIQKTSCTQVPNTGVSQKLVNSSNFTSLLFSTLTSLRNSVSESSGS